jgi:hypothetical protein
VQRGKGLEGNTLVAVPLGRFARSLDVNWRSPLKGMNWEVLEGSLSSVGRGAVSILVIKISASIVITAFKPMQH